MSFLFSMNPVAGMALFVLGMTASGMAIYVLSRRVLSSIDRLSRQLGVYMFRACGALLGFLLAVNFSAVSIEFSNIRESVDLEVAQLHDLHEDLLRYQSPEGRRLADMLLSYSVSVVEEEWLTLQQQGEPSDTAWDLFLKLEDGILLLEPESMTQRSLKSRMLTDIDEISDYRQVRVYSSDRQVVWLQTVVYVLFFLSIFYLGVFAVRPIRVLFIGLYSGAIGIILYSIISMGHPFQGVAQIASDPFTRLNEEIRAKTY